MNAKDIFEKLVDRAYMYAWRLSGNLNRRGYGKPGELIEKLSPEEREELKNLTSKDTDTARRNLDYMIGSYPENTTTVHTHSVKKETDS